MSDRLKNILKWNRHSLDAARVALAACANVEIVASRRAASIRHATSAELSAARSLAPNAFTPVNSALWLKQANGMLASAELELQQATRNCDSARSKVISTRVAAEAISQLQTRQENLRRAEASRRSDQIG